MLDVAGNVTQQAGDTITVAGLALMVDGTTTLTEAANNVTDFAALNGGTIDFVNSDGLTVGSVSVDSMTVTGITTSDDNVDLQVGDAADENLTLANAISLGSGDVTLAANFGSIIDGNGPALNIAARDATLSAATNIGEIMDFLNGTGDAIELQLSGMLTGATITDAGGEIFLDFIGDLVVAANAVVVDADGDASAILSASGNMDVGTALNALVVAPNDNLGLEAGGVLTVPDAGLNLGLGGLRLEGLLDVIDPSGRDLGTFTANVFGFRSGGSGGGHYAAYHGQ